MDYFGTADVKTVAGDADLGKIEDVVHHIRTFWAGQPVPMSLIGYGQDLNRDVLGEQKEQYDRALETVTQWVEDEIVKPLLELQWLLAGIWPDGMTYEIVWASKQVITAEDVQAAADGIAKLRATGLLPDEELIKVLVELLPVLDVEVIAAYLRTQAENEVDSLAQAIAAYADVETARRRQDQAGEGGEETTERRHAHARRAIVA